MKIKERGGRDDNLNQSDDDDDDTADNIHTDELIRE